MHINLRTIGKPIRCFSLLLLTFAVLAAWSQSQVSPQRSDPGSRVLRGKMTPGRVAAEHTFKLPTRTVAARLPGTASRLAVPTACPADAQALGAVCGHVTVPLDRNHPTQGTIPIYFELYTHTGPGPAESAILANFGGPGMTTSGNRGTALALYGKTLDKHDLLLIDDRGRGLSGAIDCPDIQNGVTPYLPTVVECAAQLGSADSAYGAGDIAEDTEAVRAALGYEKVDYHGGSYGGIDVAAYATRYGQHLRSIVLDSPIGPFMQDETRFLPSWYRTHAEPDGISIDCRRSPACSADHPFPNEELDALVWTIRHHPVEGDAYDANGNLKHLRLDESQLAMNVIEWGAGLFTSTGELLAAADALWQNDPKPLLRLEAEGNYPTPEAAMGDPTGFSNGAWVATMCLDAKEPWDWAAPLSQRKKQFDAAVAALPAGYFAPFSKQAATGLLYDYYGMQCMYWERPTPPSPVLPPHAKFPKTPTLAFAGDLDRMSLAAGETAALYPNSTFVTMAGAGHETTGWSECAAKLASDFIETLKVGDTSCAAVPVAVWPAVGRFPLLTQDARPAAVDPDGINKIGTAERKVVTVAVATATDAMQRSIIGWGDGVGLRAGTFHTDYGDTAWTTTLSNCAFAKDVTVNGTVTWEMFGAFKADLTVSGPGTAGGSLHVEGTWMAPGPAGNFQVTGTLGGRDVAVLVPEA